MVDEYRVDYHRNAKYILSRLGKNEHKKFFRREVKRIVSIHKDPRTGKKGINAKQFRVHFPALICKSYEEIQKQILKGEDKNITIGGVKKRCERTIIEIYKLLEEELKDYLKDE